VKVHIEQKSVAAKIALPTTDAAAALGSAGPSAARAEKRGL